MIEQLESRVLLAAFVSGGTLNVTSNIPNDTYFLGLADPANIRVSILLDGSDLMFPLVGLKRIFIKDAATPSSTTPSAANITIRSEILLPTTIIAGDGNDSINCGSGPTIVDAGTGDDVVWGGQGNDSFSGGSGADFLSGGAGNDTIDGGAGQSGSNARDDSILGGFGNDLLFGGAGDDSIDGGEGSDTIIGGIGNDNLSDSGGGSDRDVLSYRDHINTNTRVGILFDFNSSNDGIYNNQGLLTESDNIAIADFEIVWGSEGSDTLDNSGPQGLSGRILMGFGGNDVLIGSASAGDTLDGGSGNDSLSGGGGNDLLLGGTGNDTLQGGANSLDPSVDDQDTLDGGEGDDNLQGGPDRDSLDGGAGNDLLSGGAGDDTLFAGLDSYALTGSTTIDNSGADILQGDSGFDIVDYSARTRPVRVSINGIADDGDSSANRDFGEVDMVTESVEEVIGTNLPMAGDMLTTIHGDQVSRWFVGLAGPDTVLGGAGNDTLEGGAGDDCLNGGTGADSLVGGDGRDVADYSTRTADLFISVDVGVNDDGQSGEGGNVLGVEVVLGGRGDDTLIASDTDTSLSGGAGNDSLIGGAGNDTLDGGVGADDLDGGRGFNTADYSRRRDPLWINIDDLANDGGSGEGDQVRSTIQAVRGGQAGNTIQGSAGDELLIGGAGRDSIAGAGGNDTIVGGGENDTLVGGDGDDCLDGGAGQDCLLGGLGNDTLAGGAGSDSIFGGAGSDWVSYADHSTPVAVRLDASIHNGSLGENDSVAADIENILGGRGNDSLFGNSGNNILSGGPGNDYLFGLNGNDTLRGDVGADTLHGGNGNDLLIGGVGADRFTGGKGIDTADYSDRSQNLILTLDNLANDGARGEGDKIDTDLEILVGGAGNDSMVGSTGNYTLVGGAGDDTICGGAGNDSLVGGPGRDCIFGNAGNDTILAGDGQADSIDGGSGIDLVTSDGGLDRTANIP